MIQKQVKYCLLIPLLLGIIDSCIDRYYLDNFVNESQKLVVDGTITDDCNEQVIKISYSSSTENPSFNGASNCLVKVADDKNHVFNFVEDIKTPGYYKGTIPEEYTLTGNKFQLIVITPDGKTYKSSFEEMLPCPPVDSVYYTAEHRATESAGENIDGLQFYIDFNATDYFGRYYRWIIEETYEYHSTWPKKDYIGIDGKYHEDPIDLSQFICYKTEINNELFLLSTEGLNSNIYKKAKLHFVDDHTQRLLYNYSILVKQRSLSNSAYYFWENIKKNNQETNGLFTKQPSMLKGNIHNENDTTEVVLGYFMVSSETTKRIIIRDMPELLFNDVGFCVPVIISGPLPVDPRPMYFVTAYLLDGTAADAFTFPECIECTLLGGITQKPYFFE
jgi:hypothetical protein